MKIAGLTWWRNNYGSILQAYALQTEINKYENIQYEILCQYGRKIASVDNLADKLKHIGVWGSIRRIFWKYGLKNLRKRNIIIQRFVDEYLQVSEKQYTEEKIIAANQEYDGFLCGSDQIWNPELTSVDGIYWLGFAEKTKLKIAYAPSIGVDSVTSDQAEAIAKQLATFQAVSCREKEGSELINSILGKDSCETVLDPTLMVDRSVWDKLCTEKPDYKGSYIFVYLLRGTRKQRKLIEQFARYKKKPVLTMPFLDTEHIELYDFTFGDVKLWDVSPADFITYIRSAEYVFTDSFHCMVFSCLYHKRFYVFPKLGPAQLNRITAMQEMLGVSNRLIDSEMTAEEIDSLPAVDWKKADEILEQKRQISRQYLHKAICGK